MNSFDDRPETKLKLHALKDVRTVYRGCSLEFAQWLGFDSVAQVIGRSDGELRGQARVELSDTEDNLVLREGVPCVTEINDDLLLRIPLHVAEKVQGIDLLVEKTPAAASALWQYFFPSFPEPKNQRARQWLIFGVDSTYFQADAENQAVAVRADELRESIPASAKNWLSQGANGPDDVRCGHFESVDTDAQEVRVHWGQMYWGTEPAVVLQVSSTDDEPAAVVPVGEAAQLLEDYKQVVELSAHGLLVLESGVPVLANASAVNMLGFKNVEQLLQHRGFEELVPHDLGALLVLENCQTLLEPQQFEGTWKGLSGASLHLLSHWQQIEWGGRACCYVNLVDVSHRHRAELAQQVNQRRFQDFAELAADFFWELDTSLRFSFVSHRFENILQIAPQNVLGLSIRQFYERYFPQPAPPYWRRHLQALAEHKPQREFEYRWTRADGKERVIVHTCQPIYDQDGNFAGFRGVGRDVTQDRALAAKVQFHATHDALTGLVNRREFERLLEEALRDAASGQQQHVLCYVDLDNFKIVNDSCGHSAGDELLRQLGDLFRDRVRQSDVVARLGGDEFGILIYSCSKARALELAEKIRQSVMMFDFFWENKRFSIGASIGLSTIVRESMSANEVMRAADSACYASKERGRNQVTTAEEESGARRTDADRVIQVGSMLEEGRFKLWRQPMLAINSQYNTGEYFEILLRLIEPNGSLISPATVMPAVERYGLCPKLDRVVFDRTLEWILNAREQWDQLALCTINLSGPSLLDRELVEHIDLSIKRSGIPAKKLCFELSESATIANLSSARSVIAKLNKTGCRFALDDFGSGASSFTFLRDLPIDLIKIDGSFIQQLNEDKVCEEMVRSINRVSHVLNCLTVAERVEDERTLEALERIGVDFVQGYHIGRPEPIQD